MNLLAIIAIMLALAVGYYGLSSLDIPLFVGRGPLSSGPGRGAEVENPAPLGRGAAAPPPESKPGQSLYQGKVRIGTVSVSGDNPDEEYVTLRYGGGFFGLGDSKGEKPVDVTGWAISSRRSSAAIPRGFNIPEVDAAEQDIFLPSGGEVILLTGFPSYPRNFRENRCVGYFNESHIFTPSLSNSCADSSPERAELLRRGFNGECIETIEDVSTCRRPQGPFEAAVIKAECIDYMNQNLNYSGCVKNFRLSKDFFGDTWRVSLRRGAKLYDPRHDRIELRDTQGLLVDEFEY